MDDQNKIKIRQKPPKLQSLYFGRLFSGRINRPTYFTGMALLFFSCQITYIFLVLSPTLFGIKLVEEFSKSIIILLVLIYGFFSTSLSTRRKHDNNMPWPFGWDIWIFVSGDSFRNKYGSPPKPGIDWKAIFGLGEYFS